MPEEPFASLFSSFFVVHKKERKNAIFLKNRKLSFLKKIFFLEGIGVRFFLFMFPKQFCLNFSKIIMKKFCRTAKFENFDNFCELLLKKFDFTFLIQALRKNEAFQNVQFYFSIFHFFSRFRIFPF